MSTWSSASSIAWTRSGLASTPATRRVRAKPTSVSTTVIGGSCPAGPDQLPDADRAHPLLVLAVLEHRAQAGRGEVRVQLARPEGDEGLGPVERLGDAGWLEE